MAYSKFPLFQSHIDLAHHYWAQIITKGDHVIDATCGNGHDTLKLALLALDKDKGHLWAFDIQALALENTRKNISENLPHETLKKIHLCCQSHENFPSEITSNSIKLIVYNLGYLPGGDKSITTALKSTLKSLERAKELIVPGGAISITCYPGHSEGEKEQEKILELVGDWAPQTWCCTHQQWLNRRKAPSLLLIQKHQ